MQIAVDKLLLATCVCVMALSIIVADALFHGRSVAGASVRACSIVCCEQRLPEAIALASASACVTLRGAAILILPIFPEESDKAEEDKLILVDWLQLMPAESLT